ncbi:tRNA pseudouridine(38-40) synthase TruA [Lactococcus protaetiae]|uniref:tRNA pseudouridine synthase A n=1 Tax=Lactococcus protaetiae TaxID=2592653 RepID=A0A514Z7T5_9LACT|nr:tRNA pseudouridine(38-40) synthase TruA [Lactococcus protaetiae]MCL2113231.1 tRNA pseudouridine(38-40) synthase TruA [Streptococcaceae bacterium]QDK70654.1 tRNA pseudouridine(38-40) synthase TruA [Lactococcus protaetiae]
MTRYKATIAYDGTDFAGFQTQVNQRTVQAELEKVLTKLNSYEPVILQGSGRTDAGVHAFGQVIHFDLLGQPRDLERLRFGLDTQTPADIAVKKIEQVDEQWHARYCKHEKIYEYYLENAVTRSPFSRNAKAYFRYPLDFDRMQEALSVLTGTHDFTGFTASGSSVDDKVRTISQAEVIQLDEENFKFVFRANGFLYKQVRNMVGTVIKIGNDRMPVSQIEKILMTKNRDFAGPTAAPEGLYLKEVIYDQGE